MVGVEVGGHPAAPMASAAGLWLLRHGESGWNREGRIQGQAVAPGLTRRGRIQVASAAETWAAVPPAMVLTSDLCRARQSAQVVADRFGVPIRLDRRWRERGFGSAEGALMPLASEITGIRNGQVVDADAAPPLGESVRQMYTRVAGALRDASRLASDKRVVVVTHGGAIRVAMALASGVDPERMLWLPLDNAEIVRVECV